MPYDYTEGTGGKPLKRTYVPIKVKADLTAGSSSKWDLSKTGGASAQLIKNDGFTFVKEDEIYFTFTHTFKIPLNVIN